ncbi:MAG: M23 family metallopeptidase [Alphaproteobacteria bacterium]|nr:M23 family metallopeptidase [Alphaproteobacteria bacterium]
MSRDLLRRVRCGAAALLLALGLGLGAGAALAEPPRLEPPLKCQFGRNCWLAKYMDNDPAKGRTRDYGCGRIADDGHKGTDFAIRDQRDVETGGGVVVVAAAAGTVAGVRDGMADANTRVTGMGPVKDRECGNGVVIDHGDGWQTQYCHMAQGSVSAEKGQKIMAGEPIGRVGLSGATEYPHMHFEVRKDKTPVDPFLGVRAEPGACGAGPRSLWTKEALAAMPYRPIVLYLLGFADRKPTLITAREGVFRTPTFPSNAEVMYMWAVFHGLEEGDTITFKVTPPDGKTFEKKAAMDKATLQYLSFLAAPRPGARWPSGRYVLEVSAARSGRAGDSVVARQEIDVP